MIQIQEKDEKAHFRHGLGPLGPYSGRQCFFYKGLALSITKYYGQLPRTTSETNDLILRTLSDGRTDGRTDRQPDRQKEESDFIGHCATNVGRPKKSNMK